MEDDEKIRLYVEMWKQTIDVQKHFNDIEIRIRGLALTVLTFTLGAAAVAIKDDTRVVIIHRNVHLSALVLVIGAVLWLTFYFVDQVWYHRLLIGSVVHGEALESEIAKALPIAGLTKAISKSSPYDLKIKILKFTLFKWAIHSSAKLRIFYWVITLLLLVFAWGAQNAGNAASGQQGTLTTTSSPAR